MNIMDKPLPWGADDIKHMLPHRYPFLLVDRIVEIDPLRHIVGQLNISITNPVFQGHFPNKAIYPGVLILESLAQVGAVLRMASFGVQPDDDELYTLCAFDRVRFKHPVVPGDCLELRAELENQRSKFWRFRGEARVDGKLVSEALILCTIMQAGQV